MYSQISSRTQSACLRSLIAFRDLCLISTSFAPNAWLTASTSLHLLPCQFILLWSLATFVFCFFGGFFFMSQCQIPVPACWCTVAPGSRIGFFLICWLCAGKRFIFFVIINYFLVSVDDLSLSLSAHCLPVRVANVLGSTGSFLSLAFTTSSVKSRTLGRHGCNIQFQWLILIHKS